MKERLNAMLDYIIKHKKITAAILFVVCGLTLTNYVAKVATNPTYQWDLKMYHSAAKVFLEGGDYYNAELIREKGGRHPYMYSPYGVFFLFFLGLLSFEKAALLWVGLKLGILIVLLWIWKKIFYDYFDERNSWILFCLFLVWSSRAFNRAIYMDFRAGNISIIEEFLIWSGILFLLYRGKYVLFGLCLIAASFFKFLPIVLIGLVLVLGTGKMKDRIKQLGIISLIGSAIWAAGILIMPFEFKGWLNSARTVVFMAREKGINNPTMLPFIRQIIGNAGKAYELTLYFLWILIVFFICYFVSKKILKKDFSFLEKKKYIFFLWCLVYPLVMPRFKDYTFIFLLPVFYYSLAEIIKKDRRLVLKVIAVFLLCFSFFVLGRGYPSTLVLEYWPMLVTITSWILFVVYIMENSLRPAGGKR